MINSSSHFSNNDPRGPCRQLVVFEIKSNKHKYQKKFPLVNSHPRRHPRGTGFRFTLGEVIKVPTFCNEGFRERVATEETTASGKLANAFMFGTEPARR